MQGFNMGRYVPPDVEGTVPSGNRLHGKHALGSRASKLASHGILTVRFEMPYPIWCLHCPRPTVIGQGVRFNAEKKRAGSYFSTPIWSFRFRHAECGGWIEMRTDPKNTAYVVVEGARKRDHTGEGKAEEVEGEGAVILTDKERDELRNNAFASLERTIADRKRLEMAADRIEHLAALSERHWSDPYALNQRLRRDFRKGRKRREQDAARAQDLQARMGLGGLELVPEVEEDAQRAALVDFGAVDDDDDDDGDDGGRRALLKPLFSSSKKTQAQKQTSTTNKATTATASKAEKQASRRKEAFVANVLSNTRAAQDPFLIQQHHGSGSSGMNRAAAAAAERPSSSSLGIIKRNKGKRIDGGGGGGEASKDNDNGRVVVSDASKVSGQGLVEYDSD